jgi:hypothetical protein
MKSFIQILREEDRARSTLADLNLFKPLTIEDFPEYKQNIESYPQNSRERQRAEQDFAQYLERMNDSIQRQLQMEGVQSRKRGDTRTPQERVNQIVQTNIQTVPKTMSNSIGGSFLTDATENADAKAGAKATIATTAALTAGALAGGALSTLGAGAKVATGTAKAAKAVKAGATAAKAGKVATTAATAGKVARAGLTGRAVTKALTGVGKTLAKYGIKLGKEILEKLISELMELFKNIFFEEGMMGENNTQSDQLLQLDCQAIINRAKQTQDQYSMSVINQLQTFATQKLNVEQNQPQPQDQETAEEVIQKVQEAATPQMAKAVQTFNDVLNTVSPQSKDTQFNPNSLQNQQRLMGKNPQEMTLKTDIQNLQKKCRVVNSEFSKNLLGALNPLL